MVTAVAVGVLAGIVAGLATQADLGILIGWDAAAVVWVARILRDIWPVDAAETAATAVGEDPTRAGADAIVLGASVASLAAVGGVLVAASSHRGATQSLLVALGLVSIVVSWMVVHTVYALRYAGLYYTGPDGGIGFSGDDPPDYGDFVYLALTIGMTYQVSDTDLQSRPVRRTALNHALLSYVFGAGVVAATVNLVATLTTM
jgi:uncharacterized membrane protein